MGNDRLCPSHDILASFLTGKLPAGAEDEINRHLEVCPDCERRAQELERHADVLIEALRQSERPETRGEGRAKTETVLRAVQRPPRGTGPAPLGSHQPFHLDGYQILRELGRGGMGVVYEAYQHRLHRQVAIKMILAGTLASSEERVRFKMEGELLARLSHPNFVQVYEVGTVELAPGTVQPYLVLEHVEGGSLKTRLEQRAPSFDGAARLVLVLARAMEAAHAQGIIHRDLKPANVLFARDGTLKITDFGLAKELGASASLTPSGLTVGTPNYMAPEQAAGRSLPIGPATDVYALGAILYETLSGRPPFEGDAPMDVLLQVLNKQPVPASRGRPGVPRDLETICLKCLEKEPHARYPQAADLARDLECWLENRPIAARSAGRVERVYKWARRHPLPTAMLGAIALSLVIGSATSTYFAVTATRRANETLEALAKQETARKLAELATQAERWERYLAEIAAASSALQLHNIDQARRALEAAPVDFRNWEWRHLSSQLDGARAVLGGHASAVVCVSFSAAGQRLASVSDDVLRVWDMPAGKEASVMRPASGKFNSAAISPDGTRVASGGQCVRLWDARTGRLMWETAEGKEEMNAPVWSPDGRHLAGSAGDGQLRVWDSGTGREVFARPCSTSRAPVIFRPDGRRVAANHLDNSVSVWETATGKDVVTLRGHKSLINSLAYSPDGRRLATGSIFPEDEVRLWDAATGELLATGKGHKNEVLALAFSPDGKQLASASMDQTVRLWDGLTGNEQATLTGHTGSVQELAFSPDGTRLISASADQTLRLWDPAARGLIAVLHGHTGSVGSVRYGAAGVIASASADRTVRLWDAELVARNGVLRGHGNYVYDVAFNPRRDEAASAAWDGTVRLWDPTTGRQIGPPLELNTSQKTTDDSLIVSALAYSPDGRQLAVGARLNGLALWDLASRKLTPFPSARGGDPHGDCRFALDPHGTLLAWGSADGPVRVFALQRLLEGAAEPLAILKGHIGCSRDVAFRPDGRQLASAGDEDTVRLWDVATWRPHALLHGSKHVLRLAYSPDGRLLAAGAADKTVRLWDVASATEVAKFQLGGAVYGLAFSPDGTRLACACADNTIRLWDVAKGREVADLRGHEAYVHAVMFSPDGTRLVSGSGDFTVRIWDTLSAQARAQTR